MPELPSTRTGSPIEELALKQSANRNNTAVTGPSSNEARLQEEQSPSVPLEARKLCRSRHCARQHPTFFCLAMRIFIVSLFVYDYISRVSLLTLITATTPELHAFEPSLVAAATLTYASLFLPSIALGLCCGGHLRNTWLWAGWRAATFVNMFSGLNGRQAGPCFLLSKLLVVQKFGCISNMMLSSRVEAPRRVAAGCILPLAAVFGFLLLAMQVTMVFLAASLAVAAVWASSAVGLIASKLLLVFPGGLLHYLDWLTHGSATRLMLTGFGVKESRFQQASKTALVSNENAEAKVLSFMPECRNGGDGNTRTCSPNHSSPSRANQGLRTVGEEESECISISISTERHPTISSGDVSLGDETLNPQHGTKNHLGHSSPVEKHPSLKLPAFYSTATLSGSVPLELHPCSSLRKVMRLHRHHITASRNIHSSSPQGIWRIDKAAAGSPALSASSAKLAERELDSTVGPSGSPVVESSWRFHGTSGGLFADATRGSVGAHISTSPVCDEAKKKYWSSGLEARTPLTPHTTDSSSEGSVCRDDSSQFSVNPGLLSFAYAGSLQGPESTRAVVTESSDVISQHRACSYGAALEAAPSRWNRKAALPSKSVAAVLAGASPFRWMRRQLKEQLNTNQCLQSSPSFGTHTTRVSRPGIPVVSTWNHSKPSLCIEPQHQTLGSSTNVQGSQGSFHLKLLFAAHSAKKNTTPSAHDGEQGPVEGGPKSRWGTYALKKRRRRPFAAELDDEDYNELIMRREKLIFEWFERLVAVRYDEVKRKSEEVKAGLGDSDSDTWGCHKDAAAPHKAAAARMQPSSTNHVKGDIQWSSFDTLFSEDLCASHSRPDRVDGKLESARADGPDIVTCIQTEELFNLPVDDEAARPPLVNAGCRRQEQQRSNPFEVHRGRPVLDIPERLDPSSAPLKESATDRGSTGEANTSEKCPFPVIHYRFKDMVEMPHLREVCKIPVIFGSFQPPW